MSDPQHGGDTKDIGDWVADYRAAHRVNEPVDIDLDAANAELAEAWTDVQPMVGREGDDYRAAAIILGLVVLIAVAGLAWALK